MIVVEHRMTREEAFATAFVYTIWSINDWEPRNLEAAAAYARLRMRSRHNYETCRCEDAR